MSGLHAVAKAFRVRDSTLEAWLRDAAKVEAVDPREAATCAPSVFVEAAMRAGIRDLIAMPTRWSDGRIRRRRLIAQAIRIAARKAAGEGMGTGRPVRPDNAGSA